MRSYITVLQGFYKRMLMCLRVWCS